MGTETRYFCDRCHQIIQFKCPYLRVKSDTDAHYFSLGELCHKCSEKLKIALRDWMECNGGQDSS